VSIQELTLVSPFKTVEDVLLSIGFNGETLVVIISANVTYGHSFLLKNDVKTWMRYRRERVSLD
jgi:hypothetical protein